MKFRICRPYVMCFKFNRESDRDIVSRFIETFNEEECQAIMLEFRRMWLNATDNDMVYCVSKDDKTGFGVVKGIMKLYSIEWSLNGRLQP